MEPLLAAGKTLVISPKANRKAVLIAAERQRINDLFRSGKLKDEARRRIERELDLREAYLINQQIEE
jgi:hypothetical protein